MSFSLLALSRDIAAGEVLRLCPRFGVFGFGVNRGEEFGDVALADNRVEAKSRGLAACSVKNVKGEAGRNFRKNGAVIKNSYGLAPPDPPVPSSIRSVFGLPNLSPEVGVASLPGSTVVPFPQDCCQGFFLPAGWCWQASANCKIFALLFQLADCYLISSNRCARFPCVVITAF